MLQWRGTARAACRGPLVVGVRTVVVTWHAHQVVLLVVKRRVTTVVDGGCVLGACFLGGGSGHQWWSPAHDATLRGCGHRVG